jgi:hypothetical protein
LHFVGLDPATDEGDLEPLQLPVRKREKREKAKDENTQNEAGERRRR